MPLGGGETSLVLQQGCRCRLYDYFDAPDEPLWGSFTGDGHRRDAILIDDEQVIYFGCGPGCSALRVAARD